jgi:hypothetical protein
MTALSIKPRWSSAPVIPVRHFDHQRARDTARRIREAVELARAGIKPEPAKPLIGAETAKKKGDAVITSIGRVG